MSISYLEIHTQLLNCESPLPLSAIKILIELFSDAGHQIPSENIHFHYKRLLQEIWESSQDPDRLQCLEKLLYLILLREHDLRVHFKRSFIPSFLLAYLDSDFVHRCNLLFRTNYCVTTEDIGTRDNFYNFLSLLSSPKLLRLVSAGGGSEACFELLLHLSVSSSGKCLKQVLACVRAFSHSDSRQNQLIDLIQSLHSDKVRPAQSALGYALLTALYSYSETEQGPPLSYHLGDVYWNIVQQGLVSPDPLTRKQSIFLLKKGAAQLAQQSSDELPSCVAFLSGLDSRSEVWEHWSTVVYLFETFEETQTHILQSSLPLLYSVARFVRREEELRHANSLHYSWVVALYSRLFSHESRQVQSWSHRAVLENPLSHASQPEVAAFVTKSLVCALNFPFAFRDNTDSLLASLTNFYSGFFSMSSNVDAQHHLANLVTSLASLSDIPLFYFCYVLSKLESPPIIGREAMLSLRKLCSKAVLAHYQLMRRGVKCFLIRFLSRLIIQSTNCWFDVLTLLAEMEISAGNTAECRELHKFIRSLTNSRTVDGSPILLFLLKHFINAFINNASESTSGILGKSLDCELNVSDVMCEEKEMAHPSSAWKLALPTKSSVMIAHLALIAGNACDQSHKRMLEDAASPVIELLSCVTTHPYQSGEHTARALEVAERLLTESAAVASSHSHSFPHLVYNALAANLTEVAIYLIQLDNTGQLARLLKSIRVFELSNRASYEQHWDYLASEISALCNQEINSLLETQELTLTDRACGLVSVFGIVLSNTIHRETIWPTIYPTVQTLIYSFRIDSEGTKISAASTKDRVAFINARLLVLSLNHSRGNPLPLSGESLLASLTNLATVTNCSGLTSILGMLSSLLPSLFTEHPEMCGECVFACWRGVREESSDSGELGSLLPAFLRACLSKELLLHTQFHSVAILSILATLFDEVTEWGKQRMGGLHILALHLENVWDSAGAVRSMLVYWRQIVKILLTLPDLGKAVKQLKDTLLLSLRLPEYDFSDWREHVVQNLTHSYRTELLGVLTARHIARQEEYCALLECIIHEFLTIEIEKSKGSKKSCYFSSRLHIGKLSNWQILLLLVACLQTCDGSITDGFREELLRDLLRSHIPANNQPSVRSYIEWSTALLIISNQDALLSALLDEMRLYSSSPGTRSPFVYISYVSALSLVLKKTVIPGPLLTEVVALLIGMMGSSNTQLRHVSLDLLRELTQSPAMEELPLLDSLLQYCPDAGKPAEISNWAVLIDPERDLTLSCLMQRLPRHFQLGSELDFGLQELIGRNWDDEHIIPLGSVAVNYNRNTSRELSNVKRDEIMNLDVECKDVMQKKIMPWEMMSGEFSIGLETRSSEGALHRGELILIASLIDKPTNLGGMCRTCEVFGAAALVISDKKLLEDKSFTSLSVSAERWVSVEEVKADELPEYIADIKRQGYRVVGIEQTPNSISLQDFSFPSRSALLVGHEKFGIPVELLELVDCCLQIPQFGVIRSLNVHVTSAISIWQYTTQHLIK